ncbi:MULTISPECIES: sigma-54 dependent transcriptional regulator [unclassified Marinobacterium]|uniref:sigma-54-dependent transcriptional regulator n=1 Tax=unclassified Marinobacterium TaxID=2644139 RepID=UPI00156A6AC1|nr:MULTISPECIES: sigma-54 dependent transcriptional regulator [unclassified Marinobacterium]NRP36464.1 C4-dicarboxylate transport transcriptional regulatory protein DctD [Marinobacterium sp. xm-d-579]NRP95706.1 C4-dicarboxylate transport transcriptional regulatory protein DctD [Marinobacterium sp. xm-g-59]NRQ02729.1 C4-dicarboxylate transport transcriptional regulatory protein DctD [Marinobacterium sp. xm-d-530]
MSDMRVLIIDDEEDVRASLALLLKSSGWHVTQLSNAQNLLHDIKQIEPNLVISDVRMPGVSGLDAFLALDREESNPPFIFVSAHGDIDMAVEAMSAGAYTFLEKPYDPKRLLLAARHAGQQFKLSLQNKQLKDKVEQLSKIENILLGQSDQMIHLRQQIHEYALADNPIMLLGQTGTGKELAARAIHSLSDRSDGPFISVNCAVIDSDRFSALMFGDGDQPGYVELAEGGTLFLDEVVELSQLHQAQLLHLIEHNGYQKFGSTKTEAADIRILSATNLHHTELESNLRSDLLYRLNGLTINLPALTEHLEDVPMLFQYFTSKFSDAYNSQLEPLSSSDISWLMSHSWPGNVRELMHLAERRVLISRENTKSVADAANIKDPALKSNTKLRPALANFERALIERVLRDCEGRMDEVAEVLGIGRRTLNEKIVKLGLDKDQVLGAGGNPQA